MITGLREFRKTLSKHISLIKKGQVVIVTDREIPVASFISIDKLREIAKKANDESVLYQLKEAQADKNKEFLKRKTDFENEIHHYLAQSLQSKNRVPVSVVVKLQTILSTVQNLISEDGTLEDQRIFMFMRQKSRDPMSRILDFDYYYVHPVFIDHVKNEAKLIIEKATSTKKTNLNLSKDLKLLADMADNAIIRDKNKRDSKVGEFHSVLVRITKDGKYYSSRIYTIMPYWYERPRHYNYFIDFDSPLAERFYGTKIGSKLNYNGFQYEILSIS